MSERYSRSITREHSRCGRFVLDTGLCPRDTAGQSLENTHAVVGLSLTLDYVREIQQVNHQRTLPLWSVCPWHWTMSERYNRSITREHSRCGRFVLDTGLCPRDTTGQPPENTPAVVGLSLTLDYVREIQQVNHQRTLPLWSVCPWHWTMSERYNRSTTREHTPAVVGLSLTLDYVREIQQVNHQRTLWLWSVYLWNAHRESLRGYHGLEERHVAELLAHRLFYPKFVGLISFLA